MTARISGYRPGLVDLAAGQISREIFVNDEIYQEELERLFVRAWLFVGHESQIPKPGDFVVSGMGEESMILCRDRAGKVHVFLNSCRHRGMTVCRYDEGSTPVFTYPYHGWSYGTDGKLVGVPDFREAYHEKLDKSQWGLVEVPQLCVYKGTVWGCWDPSAPSFFEYLGDFVRYLDLTLDGWDGSEGGTEILGGIQNWLIPCNWKFPAEHFCGDSYHNISPRTIAVWHPRGPHQTEVWRWYMVDSAAPREVKDFLRDYYIRYSGPAGMTEQDDMENWNYAHAASRGTIARRYPYSYEQGLGFETERYEWQGLHIPGTVMDITEAKSSEHNLPNLYRCWAECMAADSWDELATWRVARAAE